ncbi:MAG TPA: hypothetical protein VE907_15690 [Gammaproteobacteria bacterium]|nr:hypothetical protein [Gammaproteobacteria bacterium]
MRGVRYAADTIASYLLDLEAAPNLAGKLERLDPVRDRVAIAALVDAVARATWRKSRGGFQSRVKRLERAEAMVYDALVVALGGKN